LQKLVDAGKVDVHLETTVDEIVGTNGHVSSINATKKGKPFAVETSGIFVFVGMQPNTTFLENGVVDLDEFGFIKTDSSLQTNIPGVFASGDVRSGATMQIASAVGEGVTAAISIREYLHNVDK
jgi:thioredoxin reductase (NADPH)